MKMEKVKIEEMLDAQEALIEKMAMEKAIADSAECEWAVETVHHNGFRTTGGMVFRTKEQAEKWYNRELSRGHYTSVSIIKNPTYNLEQALKAAGEDV